MAMPRIFFILAIQMTGTSFAPVPKSDLGLGQMTFIVFYIYIFN